MSGLRIALGALVRLCCLSDVYDRCGHAAFVSIRSRVLRVLLLDGRAGRRGCITIAGSRSQTHGIQIPEHAVVRDRPKPEPRLQHAALLLDNREHRRRLMHPVASTGFSEAGASGRPALAQRVIPRIPAHPETDTDAVPALSRGARPHRGAACLVRGIQL